MLDLHSLSSDKLAKLRRWIWRVTDMGLLELALGACSVLGLLVKSNEV
jgi:hypothetical protein